MVSLVTTQEFDGVSAPPHSMGSEQTVLGRVLLDNDRFDDVAGILGESDFYAHAHRLIWRAIAELVESGRPADPMSVAEVLRRGGDEGAAGGLKYVVDLFSNAIAPQHAAHHAKVVRDKAKLRRLVAACSSIMEDAHVPGIEYDELIARAEEALLSGAVPTARGDPVPLSEALRRAVLRIDERRSSGGVIPGVSTGFVDLDRITQGFSPGDLVILGARSGYGKTTLGLNIAERVARQHGPVVFISLEMPADQLADRVLAEQARVPMERLRAGRIDEPEWDSVFRAYERERSTPIQIEESPSLTVGQIAAKLRKHKRQRKVMLAVVDYLQLVKGDRNAQNREQQVASVSRGLKGVAMELGVPILVLAQLNRDVEKRPDRRPMVSDLRESGAIEQDADLIMLLSQEPWQRDAHYAELIIGKHRNGPTGCIGLAHFPDQLRFENWNGPAPSAPAGDSNSVSTVRRARGFDPKAAAANNDS